MKNYDISTLFSGMGTNSANSFAGIDLTQYASIKKGTYSKLMKTYYNKQDNKADDKVTATKKTKEDAVDSTGMSKMKSEADSLKKAVEELGKDELWTQTGSRFDMDKVTDAVKSFVKEYNDVVKQSGQVTSKDISSSIKYMESMTSTMSKSLGRVGITVGTDGTLSLDEEALKKSDGRSAKALFTGTISYGSQIADRASEISKSAVMSTSIYSSQAQTSNSLTGVFNQWV